MTAKQIIILTILGYLVLPLVIFILVVIIRLLHELISDKTYDMKYRRKERKAARKKAEKESLTAKGNSYLPLGRHASEPIALQQTKSGSPDDEKPEE